MVEKLGLHSMEPASSPGSTAASAYCKGCKRGTLGQGRLSPTRPHPLNSREAVGGASSGFQQREENAGGRQDHLEILPAEDAGRLVVEPARLQTSTAAQDLYSQEERQAPAAGYSDYEGSGHAGAVPAGARTCGGSLGRSELLRVSTSAFDCRCLGPVLHLAGQRELTSRDSRGGYTVLFRSDQPRVDARQHPHGSQGPGEMAEGRLHGRQAPLSDRGRYTPGRNHLPGSSQPCSGRT